MFWCGKCFGVWFRICRFGMVDIGVCLGFGDIDALDSILGLYI